RDHAIDGDLEGLRDAAVGELHAAVQAPGGLEHQTNVRSGRDTNPLRERSEADVTALVGAMGEEYVRRRREPVQLEASGLVRDGFGVGSGLSWFRGRTVGLVRHDVRAR